MLSVTWYQLVVKMVHSFLKQTLLQNLDINHYAYRFGNAKQTHLALAMDWQVVLLQLVPQLLVIEQMKSYLCRHLDLRDTFLWLLMQPLGLLLLLLLLLLRCRQFLIDDWRIVYASVHMSLQDTTSLEVPIADRTGSNVC